MAFGDIVQKKSNTIYPATGVTVTLDSTATSGNLLVFTHFTGSTSCTKPTGFTDAVVLQDSGNADAAAIYFKISTGTETAISATSSTSDENSGTVIEFEGPFDASPLGVTASNGATSESSTTSGTTSTTTVDDSVAVAINSLRHSQDFSPGTSENYFSSWTNSFIEQADITTAYKGLGTASKVLTATATVETTASHTSGVSMGLVAVFKGAAGGGVTVNTTTGALTYTGQAPTVSASDNQTIQAPSGSLAYAGQVPGVSVGTLVQIPSGSISYTGQVPGVVNNVSVEAQSGSVSYTGQTPTIGVDNNAIIEIPTGSIGYTGQTPTVSATANISVITQVGNIYYIGQVPTVTGGENTGGGISKRKRQQNYDSAYKSAVRRKKQREALEQAVEETVKYSTKKLKLKKLKAKQANVVDMPITADVQRIAAIDDDITRQIAIEFQLKQIEFKRREDEALALLLLIA